MEEWFREKGSEYAYMPTKKSNEASISLFTERCGYSKFQTPTILVHLVFIHRLPIPRTRIAVLRAPFRLSLANAEHLYHHCFATMEFFPRDINSVLRNPLSLDIFLAVPVGYRWPEAGGADAFLADPPTSWVVLSVWNSKEVFWLEVREAGRLQREITIASRASDRAMPWL